jgi:hypothetical protein
MLSFLDNKESRLKRCSPKYISHQRDETKIIAYFPFST